jgi:hypothetical protein
MRSGNNTSSPYIHAPHQIGKRERSREGMDSRAVEKDRGHD